MIARLLVVLVLGCIVLSMLVPAQSFATVLDSAADSSYKKLATGLTIFNFTTSFFIAILIGKFRGSEALGALGAVVGGVSLVVFPFAASQDHFQANQRASMRSGGTRE